PVSVEAAHPVLVAHVHELGVERELSAPREEPLAQRLVAPAVTDVPLTGGDDLEGLVALLVEVRLAGRGLRLAVEVTVLTQRRDHALARREGRRTRDLREALARRVGRDPRGSLGEDPSVATHDRARRQVELAPPLHVGEVTEG